MVKNRSSWLKMMKEENVVLLTIRCLLLSQKLSKRRYVALASESKSGSREKTRRIFLLTS